MLILAIETSCDDTGIAILEATGKKSPRFRILSNIVSSQVKLHAKYGGVYPSLAKREHQRNLVPVLTEALKKANQLILRPSPALSKKGLGAWRSQSVLDSPDSSRGRSNNKKLHSILEREPELLKRTLSFLKKHQKPDIDLIAVTVGPGLEPCLWVGVNFAKALAAAWEVPIVPVNHIEAHVLANLINTSATICPGVEKRSFAITRSSTSFRSATPTDFRPPARRLEPSGDWRAGVYSRQIKFPAVALIVSGGHTQLVLMEDFGKYKIIGETRDDAAGECFDKTARILGLGYPGGPAIAAEAAKFSIFPEGQAYGAGNFPRPRLGSAEGGQFSIKLPRPMFYHKNYDFSFSGLKTAVLYDFKKQSLKIRNSPKYIQAMAQEIQQAIIDVLTAKTIKAAKHFQAKSIILSGGVAANEELREQLMLVANRLPMAKFLVPPKIYCTDNAAMVAVAGYYGWLRGEMEKWEGVKVKANLRLS